MEGQGPISVRCFQCFRKYFDGGITQILFVIYKEYNYSIISWFIICIA